MCAYVCTEKRGICLFSWVEYFKERMREEGTRGEIGERRRAEKRKGHQDINDVWLSIYKGNKQTKRQQATIR